MPLITFSPLLPDLQVTVTDLELPNRPVFTGQTAKLCTPSGKIKSGTINLKILLARVIQCGGGGSGKPGLEKIGQMFTQINETNANVSYITNVITEKWGPGYVLVTADCLKIDDSDGTRGEFSYRIPLYICNYYFFIFFYRTPFLESKAAEIFLLYKKKISLEKERASKDDNLLWRMKVPTKMN